jgi:hypothetical protein
MCAKRPLNTPTLHRMYDKYTQQPYFGTFIIAITIFIEELTKIVYKAEHFDIRETCFFSLVNIIWLFMQRDFRVALPFSFHCNSFGRLVYVQPGT